MTILEVLENAQTNLKNSKLNPFMFDMGMEQLNNAILLLEENFDLYDDFDDAMTKLDNKIT